MRDTYLYFKCKSCCIKWRCYLCQWPSFYVSSGCDVYPTSLASSTFWSLFVCFFMNWHMKGKRLWYSPHCKFLLVMFIYAFCEQVGPWLQFVLAEKNICCIKIKWYTLINTYCPVDLAFPWIGSNYYMQFQNSFT